MSDDEYLEAKQYFKELEKLCDELPWGILSYTPLLHELEREEHSIEERKNIAQRYLPMALSCALQSAECLQDIKNVAEKYPDLIPEVISCAENLRVDKDLSSWTKFESAEYKTFINSLKTC